jgi:glycosyltransferase involved in cell wall biosynthesis
MENLPINYLQNSAIKYKIFSRLKNLLNTFQFKYYTRVKNAIKRSDLLISAIPIGRDLIHKTWKKDCQIMSETGCYVDLSYTKKYELNDQIHLLWVGKFDFRKQLKLALDTMAYLKPHNNIYLHVVGEGSEKENRFYRDYASKFDLKNIIWHGKVENSEVQILMKKFDIFFFTSIAEATSTVVLEAIQNKLPIICFDTCGFGSIVDESIGYKISLTEPNTSIKQFAQIILHLDKEILQELSNNCNKKLIELSWKSKVLNLTREYEKLI